MRSWQPTALELHAALLHLDSGSFEAVLGKTVKNQQQKKLCDNIEIYFIHFFVDKEITFFICFFLPKWIKKNIFFKREITWCGFQKYLYVCTWKCWKVVRARECSAVFFLTKDGRTSIHRSSNPLTWLCKNGEERTLKNGVEIQFRSIQFKLDLDSNASALRYLLSPPSLHCIYKDDIIYCLPPSTSPTRPAFQ